MNDKEKLEAIDKIVCDETETQYDSDGVKVRCVKCNREYRI